MTQIKCRSAGGAGMTQAMWKYACQADQLRRNIRKGIENEEARAAEARKNISLPKLKWMENGNL